MDPIVVRRAKLAVGEKHLTVKVANGDSIPYTSYCKAVAIQLQNVKTNANLYVLTLGGCDVVLGVDWLRSLESIAWDFSDLTMKFSFYETLENPKFWKKGKVVISIEKPKCF